MSATTSSIKSLDSSGAATDSMASTPCTTCVERFETTSYAGAEAHNETATTTTATRARSAPPPLCPHASVLRRESVPPSPLHGATFPYHHHHLPFPPTGDFPYEPPSPLAAEPPKRGKLDDAFAILGGKKDACGDVPLGQRRNASDDAILKSHNRRISIVEDRRGGGEVGSTSGGYTNDVNEDG